jgi:hypothetical protein
MSGIVSRAQDQTFLRREHYIQNAAGDKGFLTGRLVSSAGQPLNRTERVLLTWLEQSGARELFSLCARAVSASLRREAPPGVIGLTRPVGLRP